MNEFIDLMEKVENPGTFSVSGKLTSIPPGLKVEGLGIVSLPLLAHQAKALIKISEQAPYGRGEDTIVDTNVRNVWQISPQNFELINPEWEEALQKSINQIGKQLGLHGCEIAFEQYKLLIYEKGSFFTLHRDTEKIPDMFATLVINLPSEHEGGELIVSHGSQSQRYSFADNDSFHLDFLAFYADCYHEVKPVTSGYRICLIYNLAIANRQVQPLLSQQLKIVEDVSNAIQKWTRENKENPILTYLLEHDYSEENLCLSNLKNGDFAKASALLNAAEKNGCQAFLCLVTYYRTSYGETVYYDRYSHKDDFDEDDFEEYDVDGEEVYAHYFMTSKGVKINIEKLQLEEDELLAKIPLLDGPGRDFSISEASGNEGASKELWYHRGAVIIWPKDRDLDMITKMDINYGIHYLKNLLKEQDLWEEDLRQKIIRLAEYIIENQPHYSKEDISQELIAIGDIELLQKFIHRQMSYYDLSLVNVQTFIQILERFGWQYFEEDISTGLTSKQDLYQWNVDKRKVLPWINSLLLVNKSLSNEGQSVIKKWVHAFWKSSLEYRLTKGEIANMLQIVSLLKIHALTDEVIEFLSFQKKPTFLTATYGPALVSALEKLKGYDYDRAIMKKFVRNVLQRIQIDFPSPPNQPKDWFREGNLKCNCQFCTRVNQFLPDPAQSEISFYKTLKRNMTHIESEIEKSKVDLDIEIIRSPPKFQGICRKNQNRYENKRQLFDSAQKIVKELQLDNNSIENRCRNGT